MGNIIQSLWIGRELSIMERLCIASFLAHGHEFHLYVYGDVEGVPAAATLKDGNEILPESMIFQYKDFASYSGFSNFFRYKLLRDRGGWWVDTDMVCLRAFDVDYDHVFSSELVKGEQFINSGAIKAPAGSPTIEYCWDFCRKVDVAELKWGVTGPKLIAEAVRKFGLEDQVMPYDCFCPLSYDEWRLLLEPGCPYQPSEKSFAIHLWNEMWRRNNQDKNHRYSADCLYERLKTRYLGEGAEGSEEPESK